MILFHFRSQTSAHEHSKPPNKSVHFWISELPQILGLASHSLILVHSAGLPSLSGPAKPELHLQRKLPSVSSQNWSGFPDSQGFSEHSFIFEHLATPPIVVFPLMEF